MFKYYSNFERGRGGFMSRTIEVGELGVPGAYTYYDQWTESRPFYWDGCVKTPFESFGDLMDYLDIERKRAEREEKLNKIL